MHDKKDLTPGFETDNARNMLEAALQYIGRGFSLIPISRQKKPLIPWVVYQEKQPSPDEIHRWFEEFPNANVAIVTGQISGLVVLDLDKENAIENLKECVVGYDFSSVPTSITGRGSHLYFKHPGYPVKNGINILPGIDIRADGGCVVGPPSIHETGKQYQWLVPLENGLPPLPEEILRLLEQDKKNRKEYRERFDSVQALNGVPDGQRDHMLFKFACSLRSANVPQDYAEKLIPESAQKCQPPFPKELALQKVYNAYRNYQPNFTSDYIDGPSEVRSNREVNAGDLQRRAEENPESIWQFLPVLGKDGYIVKSLSHLIASYPRTGKTELLVQIIAEWPEERILYFSEEWEGTWAPRMRGLPHAYDHLTIIYAMGMTSTEIIQRIQEGNETVVIIDTVRNLLGLKDETDNSEVARVLNPVISAVRKTKKTFIMVHHCRKGGGQHREGITGGHAFVDVVDIALELNREGNEDTPRRILRG